MNREFIVLGSPRSGTSLIAGILDGLGVYMGERFLPPGEFNPRGSFENLDFVELNNKIIACIKGDEYGEPNQDRLSAAPEVFADEVREVVGKNRRELWGWKDPRTSFTLPVFLPHLENPTILISRRNKEAIINSLKNVGNPEERAVRTVESYYKYASINSAGISTIAYHYEEFIYAPELTLRRFTEEIRVGGDIRQVAKFIDPKLRHF